MDFVVPCDKVDILLRRSQYIRTTFDVQVLVQQEPACGKQWIRLCTRHSLNGKESLQKAKEYIEALCCPEITETISNVSSHLISNLDIIAKTYSVVATSDSKNMMLCGSQMNVALAKSWIEKENVCTPPSDNSASSIQSCRKFAKKLGYSETDIEVVAKNLGPGPVDINTFLQELIRRNRSRTTSTTGADIHSRTISSSDSRRKADIIPRGISSCSMQSGDSASERKVIELAPRHESLQPDGGPYNQRPIIIDGSNVAMHHGQHRVFSCRGISLCVQWFQKRGYTEVYVLVPRYRLERPRHGYPIEDQHLLIDLENKGVVKCTPSRRVEDGRDIVCYDDRFILDLAHKLDGVIVSNDEYRDLKHENADWKHIIEKRVLMFSFVRDLFMVPEDPLGRKGPKLNEFLSRRSTTSYPRLCPWMENCTYGSKCRYYHPDKEQEMVEESWASCQGLQSQQKHLQHQQQQQQQQQDHQHLQLQEYWTFPMPQEYISEQYRYQQQQHQAQLGQYQYHDQQLTSSWAPTYSMPPQYSYTPPNSFVYNNSGNSYNQQMLFAKLIEIFPDDGESIQGLLEEYSGKENVEQLIIEKLLSK